MRSLKTIIFTLALLISVSSCKTEDKGDGSDVQNKGIAEITFNDLEYSFGKITEGEKVACVFKFKNTGDGDLIINSATTSCGCTVPRFDDKPIKPGGEGSMEVVFDSSHREGTQTKTITVRSNASVKVIVLRIIAEVIMEDN
jgi:hypothetical protein